MKAYKMKPTLSLFLIIITQHLRATIALDSIDYRGNETDYTALLAIKKQLIDPNGVLSSWNNSLHHCFWDGVTCGIKHKRVIVLDLHERRLSGTISPFIGNLSFLRGVGLFNNTLNGPIPPEIGRLFRLQALFLNNNSLTGEIPTNISGCISLQILYVANNYIQGKLPMGLGALSNLQQLLIHSNNISGPLFKAIGNLTSLESISCAYNAFTGTIPDTISRMTNLTWLSLSLNKLSGTIPPSIFNLSSLQILALPFNQLQGHIPSNLAFTLPQLQRLGLENNFFSGPFPISILNLTSLQEINLSKNDFTGRIPFHFGHLNDLKTLTIGDNNLIGDINFISTLVNCSKLEQLDLRVNHFTGKLPKMVANLSTTLTKLVISRNPITGRIPIGISNLVNLVFLSMSRNGLTGTIPHELWKLQHLEWVDFSFNSLTGNIPDSFRNLSFLTRLYLLQNQLQGRIPPSLGSCASLLYLNMSCNNFSGTLPVELFGGSAKLIEIDLSQNQLQGSLPIEIGLQENLEGFVVSKNNLVGVIPDVFGKVPGLQILYMEENFFHGLIPPSLSYLKSLLKLDLSQNNLSGPLPDYFSTFPSIYLNLSYNNFDGVVPTKGVFANASAVSLVGNIRLCGGIRELHLPTCVEKKRTSRPLNSWTILIIWAFLGVLVATFIWFYVKSRSKKRKSTSSSDTLVKDPFFKVSYDMLLKATDGFSTENLLGSGAFGSVFKGILDGKTIAVKVLNLQQRGGSKSFMAECEALKNIRHRNLVGILTACSSIDFQRNEFKALVYEFMPNGSVERWLHEDSNLSLLQRVDLSIDVAHALNYLHHECGNPIVHADLKPSNILLDNDMVAHVSDFGLAKVLTQPLHPNQSSSIGIRGTIGYAAPEYGVGSEVSPEADLYSYGILLLELMIRKRPTNDMFKEDFNLHTYAKVALPDQVLQIVDSVLMEDESDDEVGEMEPRTQTMLQKREECMMLVVKIGVACSSHFPHDRMKITEALSELLKARNILCNPRRRRNFPRGT